MFPLQKTLMAATAVMALSAGPAFAEKSPATFEQTTVIQQEENESVKTIDFMKFDDNNNGILSMSEVGESLFYIFDTDGNEIIDNIEFNEENVYTLHPMKKETVLRVDLDGDGKVDMAEYSVQRFLQTSNLSKFDEEDDGLSAHDFIEQSFLEQDDNDNKAISLSEWKDAYTESVLPKNAQQSRYN